MMKIKNYQIYQKEKVKKYYLKLILFLEKRVLEKRINQIDNIINEIKNNITKQTDL